MHKGSRFPIIENNYRHMHPLLCCCKTANGAGEFFALFKGKEMGTSGRTYTQSRDGVGKWLLAIFRGRSMVTVYKEFMLTNCSVDRALKIMQGMLITKGLLSIGSHRLLFGYRFSVNLTRRAISSLFQQRMQACCIPVDVDGRWLVKMVYVQPNSYNGWKAKPIPSLLSVRDSLNFRFPMRLSGLMGGTTLVQLI